MRIRFLPAWHTLNTLRIAPTQHHSIGKLFQMSKASPSSLPPCRSHSFSRHPVRKDDTRIFLPGAGPAAGGLYWCSEIFPTLKPPSAPSYTPLFRISLQHPPRIWRIFRSHKHNRANHSRKTLLRSEAFGARTLNSSDSDRFRFSSPRWTLFRNPNLATTARQLSFIISTLDNGSILFTENYHPSPCDPSLALSLVFHHSLSLALGHQCVFQPLSLFTFHWYLCVFPEPSDPETALFALSTEEFPSRSDFQIQISHRIHRNHTNQDHP